LSRTGTPALIRRCVCWGSNPSTSPTTCRRTRVDGSELRPHRTQDVSGITDTPSRPLPATGPGLPRQQVHPDGARQGVLLNSVEAHWQKFGWVRGGRPVLVAEYGYWAFNRIAVTGAVCSTGRVFVRLRYPLPERPRLFAARRHDLLVLNICKGNAWAPLCKFLDRPVQACRSAREPQAATADALAG